MKQVSIIIVTYNSENDIFDCVQSIIDCADIPKQNIELIIVDNCSQNPQPMFEILRNLWGDDIITVENTVNGGYGQGNNLGIKRASAPLILIMNPDVRLSTPFFRKPIEIFASDFDLIMYGAKQMKSPSNPSNNSFWFSIYKNGYIRTIMTGFCNRLDIYLPRYMYLSGSCFYIRKSKFEKVGLFDEDVFMYGEESDIHYRLLSAFGPYFKYDASLKYLHLTKSSQPDFEYEKKLLEVDLYHHRKKGLLEKQCLENYLRINNILLGREYLRKLFNRCDSKRLEILKQMRVIIKQKLYVG